MTKANLTVAASAEIKIEKGVPLRRTSSANAKYPFRQMEVGDSFLFPAGFSDAHYYGMARQFTNSFMIGGERKIFKARKTDDGFRCWRVE